MLRCFHARVFFFLCRSFYLSLIDQRWERDFFVFFSSYSLQIFCVVLEIYRWFSLERRVLLNKDTKFEDLPEWKCGGEKRKGQLFEYSNSNHALSLMVVLKGFTAMNKRTVHKSRLSLISNQKLIFYRCYLVFCGCFSFSLSISKSLSLVIFIKISYCCLTMLMLWNMVYFVCRRWHESQTAKTVYVIGVPVTKKHVTFHKQSF